MADSNATNQKKRLMSTRCAVDGDRARTVQPIPYIKKGGGKTTSQNQIEVWKCDQPEHAQRTYTTQCYLIHDRSHIGRTYGGWPSWYVSDKEAEPPVEKGIANKGVIQRFAIADEKSSDLMIEGRWAVRDRDKSHQDAYNGPGEFRIEGGTDPIGDESNLVFWQCSTAKLILECSHGRRLEATGNEKDPPVLQVYIGDTVTMTAVRRNLAESPKASPEKQSHTICDIALYKSKHPAATEKKHAAFDLVRGGCTNSGAPLPTWDKEPKRQTLDGNDTKVKDADSKATLDASYVKIEKDWLLEDDSEKREQAADKNQEAARKQGDGINAQREQAAAQAAQDKKDGTAARKEVVQANYAYGQSLQDARPGGAGNAAQGVVNADKRRTAAQTGLAQQKAAQDAHETQASAAQVKQAYKIALNAFSQFKALFFYQPLTIDILAHGCSGGHKAKIQAFPRGRFGADLWQLKDFPVRGWATAYEKLIKKPRAFITAIEGVKETVKGDEKAGTTKLAGKAGVVEWEVVIFLFRSGKNEADAEPYFRFVGEYLELTRDATGEHENKALKKYHVGRAWSLEVGVQKLARLKFDAEVSLLKFAGPVGWVLEVLHWLGVDVSAKVCFGVDLSLGIGGTVEFDEYGAFKDVKGDATLSAKADITLKLTLLGLEAGINIEANWNPTAELRVERSVVLFGTLKSQVTLAGKAYFKGEVHGWLKKGEEKDYPFFEWSDDIEENMRPLFGEEKAKS